MNEYTDYVNSVYEDSGYTSAEEYEEDYTKDETLNTILYNKVMDFLSRMQPLPKFLRTSTMKKIPRWMRKRTIPKKSRKMRQMPKIWR